VGDFPVSLTSWFFSLSTVLHTCSHFFSYMRIPITIKFCLSSLAFINYLPQAGTSVLTEKIVMIKTREQDSVLEVSTFKADRLLEQVGKKY
jgi:hypothetical protein